MNPLLSLPTDRHHDSTLLEGLFQLVINGETGGEAFQQLDASVYERLASTYDAEDGLIGSAPVSRAF